MKILHIIPALEAGGVETGTLDLALRLKKLGENIIVISSGGKLVKELESKGIRHIKLPVHKKSPSSFLLVPHIASIIKEEHVDIVHASSRIPAWIAFLACKMSKTPFVTSCHGFYSKKLASRVMGWGKLVMVISKSVGERMRNVFGVPPEKIRLVYRGVDLNKYPYYPAKYDEGKSSFTVINIGRLTPTKGQYEFIKAMKRVVDKAGSVEAWIVGGPKKGRTHYLKSLKYLAKDLGIENNISFLGLRYDIKDLLKKADCLVLSANVEEGFGRTIIEAGATGTACCASDVGGVKEVIESGVTGLLFPARDEKKMAEAILRMYGDKNLRKRCTGSLRKKIEERFTLEKMARETLAVYKEALSSQTSDRDR